MRVLSPAYHSRRSGYTCCGRCEAGNLNYFGYKFGHVNHFRWCSLIYDLVAANCDERAAAEVVLQWVKDDNISGNKGFLSLAW
jgi:hypothetical protein